MTVRRRGTILIVTLWVILVLAGLTLVLARTMRVELVCSANETSMLQADAVEQAALQYVLSSLTGLDGQPPDEEETNCEAVQVGQGAFWIMRPDFADDGAYSFGIADESGRLNVNTATPEMLLKLTDMTEELAGSIVDWRDPDSDISAGGAESEYYLLLGQPYQCKNAPAETIDELLLVKDMTPDILYGEDLNRNGVLDANENDGDEREPADNRDGKLDRGLAPFLTVYSAEPNSTPNAQPPVLRGLINVNTAPAEVLACLPGLEQADVDALIARRAESGVDLTTVDWVAGVLPREKFQPIRGLITVKSYQFSADIVSVAGDGRAFKRCRIVVDARTSPPRVVYRQDLTHLGWPLDSQIISRLRAGATIEEIAAGPALSQEVRP